MLSTKRVWPVVVVASLLIAVAAGCAGPRPGKQAFERRGDEIVAAGQYFHTGAPVVLWTDPGGYDAYRVERRFVPWDDASWEDAEDELNTPNRFNLRGRGSHPPERLEQIRGGGWSLDQLREQVDQFVIHYDACGTSRRCFEVLHDRRGLSVHFMLDVDGTIYQTLDLKERAWHAGAANDRSIGIEIANVGAYPPGDTGEIDRWYGTDDRGAARLVIPASERPWIRTPDFEGAPARPGPVTGAINGRELVQHDLTPEQYESLEKLTRALVRVFPKLRLDVPRDASGRMITERPLTPEELAAFRGVLGHHHVTPEKVDPGPAFQWERVIGKPVR